MAKYKVLRPIEHNLKLYLPAGPAGARPATAASTANGQTIPVDGSGQIELTDAEAAAMTAGQVQAPAPAKSKARGGAPVETEPAAKKN